MFHVIFGTSLYSKLICCRSAVQSHWVPCVFVFKSDNCKRHVEKRLPLCAALSAPDARTRPLTGAGGQRAMARPPRVVASPLQEAPFVPSQADFKRLLCAVSRAGLAESRCPSKVTPPQTEKLGTNFSVLRICNLFCKGPDCKY